ncbi:galactosylceramide sulfotransferase-like [Diadema antillarum]|uniref:galactosylceramide sulfotransferase-like n=1 Tax=Diadema antillarum TaxID=105358 RepID=UPI003A88A300
MSEPSKSTKPRAMFFWSLATLLTVLVVWTSSTGGGRHSWQLVASPTTMLCQASDTRAIQTKEEGNVMSSNGTCSQQRRIVFVKTHKTASSTTASILERFGYLHNLSFAVRPAGHILTENSLFDRSVVADQEALSSKNCSNVGDGFDMLTNHARYNRPEMDAVVHHAKYVTIIREPVAQFESAFSYFRVAEKIGLSKYDQPIEEFMKQPRTYLNMRAYDYYWQAMRNQQLFDLGLDHKYHDDEYMVDYKIETLAKEIDLVMITEYYHESLLLLKKLLCWDFDDILYLSNGVRVPSRRYSLSPELRTKIRSWNCADAKLYERFNRTFWEKVQEYGPSFYKDLATFERMQTEVTQECIDFTATVDDGRELRYKPKSNASARCRDILRGDVSYTSLIQDRMRENGEVSSKFSLAYLRDLYYSVFHS